MKHVLSHTLALIGLGLATFAVTPAHAQTTANGPYYATPSWDQTLPSATRFIVLSNFNSQAVLDRETGLVWERAPSTDSYKWTNALSLCRNVVISNRAGWRLPTFEELSTLLDNSQGALPLPVGHPFQGIQADDEFWSASTNEESTGLAYHVGMHIFGNGFGLAAASIKTRTFRRWCVRGGSGAANPVLQ